MVNLLTPTAPNLEGVGCPSVCDAQMIKEGYSQYTTDESRLQGTYPQRIYFPRTTLEVCSAMKEIVRRGEKVTVSGARTGIVGGAAPQDSANLICLEELRFDPVVQFDSSLKKWIVSVAAGTTLEELQRVLRHREYRIRDREGSNDEHVDIAPPEGLFYPVDPTETTASLGGTAATNASGARTLFYGPTRRWVATLTVVLADGRVLHLKRGEKRVVNGEISLALDKGGTRSLTIPDLPIPPTKHTAGYYLSHDMDPIDFFIGAEGTLGIITEIDFILDILPEGNLYTTIFLSDDDCTALVRDLKQSALIKPLALEYMDSRSIGILREFKNEQGDSSGVPDLPQETHGVLYLELRHESEEELEGIYEGLAELLAEHGIDIEATWAGFSQADLEAMKKFRHALPERINSIIASRKREVSSLTKIGTDMAVPDEALPEILHLYRETLSEAGLEFCLFGHIGNGHVHINILPRNEEERQRGLELYSLFAERAVAANGSVAGEHGIGKLKKKFMKIQYSERDIDKMKAVRAFWDSRGTLNPGVLFD
jgi:D-lactate dehydrogenase (cytochrome)